MSVLLAHPGLGQFVRENVEALDAAGLLDRFATTVIRDPSAGWQRLIALGGAMTRDFVRLLDRRVPPAIRRDRIASHPSRELLRAAVSRVDRRGVCTDRVWDWMSQNFSAWSVRCIGPGTKAVFASEYNALELFEAALAKGLKRILELPSAEHDFVAAIVAAERARAGHSTPDAYARHTDRLRVRRTARRRREVELATLVIVNSGFSRSSYADAGYPIDKFVVLPLGAPQLTCEPRAPHRGPVRIAWGGNFAWHKGAALLVDALVPLADRDDMELDVFGQVQLPDSCVARLPKWVRLHGAIPRDQFLDALSRADVLVHPSLSDGFAMVVTEAMSLGVAPIVSSATGASELVTDGECGLVVEAGNVAKLRDAIAWAAENRDAVVALGVAARRAAERWTWRDYRHAFAGIVGDHVRN